MNTLRFSMFLLLLTAQAAVAPELEAQQGPPGAPPPSALEVVGTSYILPGGGSTITAYAATEIGSDLEVSYVARVEGNLTMGGTLVYSAANEGSPAQGILSYPSGAALLRLESDHYIEPWDYVPCAGDGVYDPYHFDFVSSEYGQGWIVVDAPYYEPDFHCATGGNFQAGTTWWEQYGGAPLINGISPNGITLASSGTLTIAGNSLTADGTDSNPTVSVASGSGLTLNNVVVVSDTELQVGYTIDGNGTSAGAHGITVTTVARSEEHTSELQS